MQDFINPEFYFTLKIVVQVKLNCFSYNLGNTLSKRPLGLLKCLGKFG